MHGVRDDAGLTPREARYCSLVAQGYSQADAFRTAFNASKLKPEQVYERAWRLSKRPKIMGRVRELLIAARLSDIDSVGQAVQRTLHALHEAERDRQWTAFAALNRQVLSMHNLLRDSFS